MIVVVEEFDDWYGIFVYNKFGELPEEVDKVWIKQNLERVGVTNVPLEGFADVLYELKDDQTYRKVILNHLY